ncbi:MAG TPA: hypothetical protein DCE56_00800 [Cyanobacteria bacterium UBA8553]|nr:hypothetical protein [Cyanobacteria bacterium UBA8553]HAJ60186.1 hypothetical protein [Cyanobacteria bacterium UBA8543]
MTQNFLPNPAQEANAPVLEKTPDAAPPGREKIKYLLIGSPRGVRSTIHLLHVLGFAEATAWSPLQSTSNPGEVISILKRYIELR